MRCARIRLCGVLGGVIIALVTALPGVTMADEGDTAVTARVVAHHGAAMAGRNLDEVMSDYAEDAVLIDPAGVARGKAAIRRSFEQLLKADLPMSPPTRQVIEQDIAWLVWTPAPGKPGRLGTETLVVRGGKIVAQTVSEFGGPPPGH